MLIFTRKYQRKPTYLARHINITMDKSKENNKTETPEDTVPWDGTLMIDPATVSRILESWEIFEDIERELSKKANS